MENYSLDESKSFRGNKTKIFVMSIAAFLLIASIILMLLTANLQVNSLRNISLAILALFIVLLFSLIVIVHKFFSSLGSINESALSISQGNLNVSDILIEKNNGLESLAIAFNDMKSNFLNFIELTKGNIITLSDSIERVSGSIDVSYQGNEQIAANMNSIAEMAEHQLNLVRDTIESMESSGSRIEKVTLSIDNMEKHIEETVVRTNKGTLNMNSFYKQLNNISSNLDSTRAFVTELNQEISKITEISGFIIQISEQLKLLGLNASIEAARAGESGKSFSIVAGEIGKLSSKTQDSIKEIGVIVGEVIKRSENVSESIGSFVNNFNASKVTFNTVQESFDSIKEQSEVLNTDIKQIFKEISSINSLTKETKEKGVELQNASDEISSKTQNVAAVTEEGLAELEEITNNTTSLKDMLSGIQKLVKRFNTSVLPVEQKSQKKIRLAFITLLNNDYWYAIRRGAIYAQKELSEKNAVVDFVPFDTAGEISVENRIIAKIKECIKSGYDGIVLPPFWSELIPVVDEASRKGISVMLFSCDFPVKSSRLAHFSPNVSESGSLAAKYMLKALNNSGNFIIARDETTNNVHNLRRTAILEVIKKNKKVKVVEELITGSDGSEVYPKIKEYLSSNKDVQGILVLGGVEGAAKAVEELGLTGKVKVVGFDHSKEIFEYIKKGIIYAAIGQDPFGQGHDPLIWLYNHIVTGQKLPSENMWSRLDVVDSNNVNDLLVG